MPSLRLVTSIDAAPGVVFDLSLDVGLHTRSTGAREEVVGGVTSGMMTMDDEVTWRAWHFGIPWTMTSKITAYDRPRSFVDEQQRGPFRSWWHRHGFTVCNSGTEMLDEVYYSSPAGPIGRLVDRVFLESYMQRLLTTRNACVKHEAEQPGTP